jgi:hypothetical protein
MKSGRGGYPVPKYHRIINVHGMPVKEEKVPTRMRTD